MLSTRTCRPAVRAAASSLTSTPFRTVRRLTMARAIRPAIPSRRGIPLEPTRPRRGESRNGRQGEGHARAGADGALDTDRAAVRVDERLDDGEPEPRTAHGADVGRPIVRLEDALARLVRNPRATVQPSISTIAPARRAPSRPPLAGGGDFPAVQTRVARHRPGASRSAATRG